MRKFAYYILFGACGINGNHEKYNSQLREWPKGRDGDSAGIQDLSDFLIRCREVIMKELVQISSYFHFSPNVAYSKKI